MSEHLPGWDAPEVVSLADCGVKGGRGGDRVALCQQRTREWLGLRKGCVTASNVHKIMGIKGAPSKSATRDAYLYELVAERLTNTATEHHVTAAMQRGIDFEPDARAWYASRHRPVRECGFVFLDTETRSVGASPDGLCEDRGIEIKVMMPTGHCRTLDKIMDKGPDAIPAEHRLQMQFSMWVTGLRLWDYVLYQPQAEGLPCCVAEVLADKKLHAAMVEVVMAFAAEVAEAVSRIQNCGEAEV